MTHTYTPRRGGNTLSERQKKILHFIEGFLKEFGYPPTIREIGEAVQIGSTSVVNYNLNKLVKAGYIERAPEVSRGLRLLKYLRGPNEEAEYAMPSARDIVQVPYAGRIVASEPVPIPGDDFGHHIDEDEMIEVPQSLINSKYPLDKVYALRVNGDSMVDALVGDRDIVILHRQDTAENGDMVAVWLRNSNETTLKYFYREGATVRLQPANSTMQPIYVDARQVQIQGRVLAVLRQLP
jgi:repressor LexA